MTTNSAYLSIEHASGICTAPTKRQALAGEWKSAFSDKKKLKQCYLKKYNNKIE